jgi:dimethylsulfoniopropionate demethylase
MANDKQVGQITSAAWSPNFETNVAIGMVRMTHWKPGTEFDVVLPNERRTAKVNETFWL